MLSQHGLPCHLSKMVTLPACAAVTGNAVPPKSTELATFEVLIVPPSIAWGPLARTEASAGNGKYSLKGSVAASATMGRIGATSVRIIASTANNENARIPVE